MRTTFCPLPLPFPHEKEKSSPWIPMATFNSHEHCQMGKVDFVLVQLFSGFPSSHADTKAETHSFIVAGGEDDDEMR